MIKGLVMSELHSKSVQASQDAPEAGELPSQDKTPSSLAQPPHSAARRRLVRSALAAGPVGLALYGRSALAQTASVCRFTSTWASIDPTQGGNVAGLSHHRPEGDPGCGVGFSGGYWRQPQHRSSWPTPTIKPDSILTTDTGGTVTFCGNGTPVNDVFPGRSGCADMTFSRLLQKENGTDIWHFCAAILNAHKAQGYPLTPQNVKDMWINAYVVGGLTWSRSQALAFIKSVAHPTGTTPILNGGATGTVPDPLLPPSPSSSCYP
jgi:hypothetical protein